MSACNSVEGGNDSETEDVMSKLPMEVREKIVGCMPIQDAVTTSVLSKTWRYCWITIPHLVFDYSFNVNVVHDREPMLTGMIDIVNQILQLHSGPIYRFSVLFPEILPDSLSYDINDRWLILLSKNSVKQIEVDYSVGLLLFPIERGLLELPSSIYSCFKLTHLKLLNCALTQAPPEFKGFQHLTVLQLHAVVFQTGVLENMVNRAMLLQELVLADCEGVDLFKFRGPNLKYLFISGEFNSISLTDTHDLAAVTVELSNPRFNNNTIMVYFHTLENDSWCSQGSEVEFILPERMEPGYIKVTGGLPRIVKLSLRGRAFKLIVADEDPERLLLDQLKYLEVNCIFRDTSHFLCALGLIRSSPNLQEIIISGLSSGAPPGSDYSLPRSYREVHANCILNQLQTVKLTDMLHDTPELELVKYIIPRAPSLEVLSFESHLPDNMDLDLMLLKELMQCPGASPKTKLVFLDPHEKDYYYWYGSEQV